MALHSRMKRINEELKTHIAQVIAQEVKDPVLSSTLTTVTQVYTSKDLSNAQIYVSILGDDQQTKEVLAALKRSTGFIKTVVADRVALRYMPKLIFRLDETARTADRINRLIFDIERQNPDAFKAEEEENGSENSESQVENPNSPSDNES